MRYSVVAILAIIGMPPNHEANYMILELNVQCPPTTKILSIMHEVPNKVTLTVRI